MEELKTMKTDKIKNLEEIEMEVVLLERRKKIRKLWSDLDDLEIGRAKIKRLKRKKQDKK